LRLIFKGKPPPNIPVALEKKIVLEFSKYEKQSRDVKKFLLSKKLFILRRGKKD